MKHGPIALIDAEMPVVIVATQSPLYEKVLSNIQEIKARKKSGSRSDRRRHGYP